MSGQVDDGADQAGDGDEDQQREQIVGLGDGEGVQRWGELVVGQQ
jgi:hypothetical protein